MKFLASSAPRNPSEHSSLSPLESDKINFIEDADVVHLLPGKKCVEPQGGFNDLQSNGKKKDYHSKSSANDHSELKGCVVDMNLKNQDGDVRKIAASCSSKTQISDQCLLSTFRVVSVVALDELGANSVPLH